MDFIGDIAHTVSDRISHLIHGDEHHENEDQVKNLTVQDPNNPNANRNPLLDDDEEVEDAAIEAARQEYESIKPSPQFKCGPVLRYQDTLVDQRRWVGSVLIVTDRQDPPRLVIQDPTKSQVGYSSARKLYTWEGSHFYRYEIQLTLLNKREKNVKYWFETENGRRVQTPQTWNFFVPALDNAFNWAFYSCNGFTSDVEDPETNFHGANPLWDDLLAAHDGKPFHAMVGGGDQIYNDDVLATPEMVEWLALDEEARVATEFTNEKKYAVEKFYFDHYTSHFASGTYSKALSLIPMVNCWDDHDILDGYGSYPAKYQLCAVMQGRCFLVEMNAWEWTSARVCPDCHHLGPMQVTASVCMATVFTEPALFCVCSVCLFVFVSLDLFARATRTWAERDTTKHLERGNHLG